MGNQKFTAEFREEEVRQVLDRGYSVKEVGGQDLGVSTHSLPSRSRGYARARGCDGTRSYSRASARSSSSGPHFGARGGAGHPKKSGCGISRSAQRRPRRYQRAS